MTEAVRVVFEAGGDERRTGPRAFAEIFNDLRKSQPLEQLLYTADGSVNISQKEQREKERRPRRQVGKGE